MQFSEMLQYFASVEVVSEEAAFRLGIARQLHPSSMRAISA